MTVNKSDSQETEPLNNGVENKIGILKKGGKTKKKEGVSYIQLYRYATLWDKILIAAAVICSMICAILQLVAMVIFSDISGAIVEYATKMNETLSDEEKSVLKEYLYSALYKFVIDTCIYGIFIIIATYLSNVFLSWSALRQIYHIRKLFLEKTLNQDISWFDLNKSGDFATTFTDNLARIEDGIGEKVGMFVFFETIFVAGIIMGLSYGWKLALVCISGLPVTSIIMAIIAWLSTKFSKKELEAYGEAGAVAEEVLSSIRTVAAFDGTEKEYDRYYKHLITARNSNLKKNLFTGISNGLTWFFIYAAAALSFWYGVRLVVEERDLPPDQIVYTPANMLAVYFCTVMASWNFGMGSPYLEVFGAACGAASSIFEMLDQQPDIHQSKTMGKKTTGDGLNGEITFSDIHFSYPSRPDIKILQDFNLSIKIGETVALVGSSGCGKSTCIQLIQRFYDPAEGTIKINGIDIRSLNLSWLRGLIGVVGQEPALFATTIAENIRYGNLRASQSDIEKAAKKANAHDFITNLPLGYETVIGERGSQLSGGQKQRIAIARALVRQPKILLLDEATSALDTTSEAEVQAALDAISSECTTIIVAHRLSTIRNADRIIVIHEGKVVEQGNHKELMLAKGAYFNLVTTQATEQNDSDTNQTDIIHSNGTVDVEKKNNKAINISVENLKEEETEPQSSILAILKVNKPEWFYILCGCLMSLLTGASLPFYGLIFGDIVGVLASQDNDYLRAQGDLLALYIFILAIVAGVATFLQMYSFGVSGENLTLRLRSRMFATILKQEMAWFDRKENGVGAVCAALSGDTASVQGASGVRIGTLLNSFSTFIISNITSLYFQWKLALVLSTLSPMILISTYLEQKLTQNVKNEKFLANSVKIAVEAITNVRTVASLGCEKVFYEKYVQSLKPYVKNVLKQMHFRSFIMGMARSIFVFAYALGMGYGVKLIIEEDVDYGVVFKVAEILIVGSWSIGVAFSFSPNFQKGLNAAGRIFQLFNRVPQVKNASNPIYLDSVDGDIEYSQIDFAYPTRPNVPVLAGLDLSILQGKTVALVGSSGCGKSTIIQLLQRFYDPQRGKTLLDDEDVKKIDIKNLRSHLGVVSQEPNLFDRTVAENIAYGANHRKVTMDEIEKAAKMANIHNFVTSLPLGYETNLGSKGTQLSGGQKQRIAIARALIRNPRVLLLDEATSALDNESEKVVQDALDHAKEGRTCITIAHRLTTIQDADVICVLHQGVVVEMGRHSELLDKKGMYYKFHQLQSGQS